MSSVNFSISGNSLHNNLTESLSTLQQNQELVDMTLAADGHFVKVHQLVLALASPYLKHLIASASGQHPVIFLNNVSSQNLSLLLEYIYTGEAVVPEDCIKQFIAVGKSLHVRGLEDLTFRQNIGTTASNTTRVERLVTNPIKRVQHDFLDTGNSIKRLKIARGRDLQQVTVPALAKNVKVTSDTNVESSQSTKLVKTNSMEVSKPKQNNSEDDNVSDSFMEDVTGNQDNQTDPNDDNNIDKSIQFTVSNRGFLQVILNRYIYNFVSLKQSSGVRRWRCIDYRERKCLAFLTTQGNIVLTRGNIHNHSFHDKKIIEKIAKNSVFTAIDEAERFVTAEKSAQENSEAKVGL